MVKAMHALDHMLDMLQHAVSVAMQDREIKTRW